LSVLNKIFKSGQAFAWAIQLVAFSIPILKLGLQIPILILIVVWVFTPKQNLNKVFWPILVFSGIYLFHAIGLLYTSNIGRGLEDMEQKLSLLLFPIIVGTAVPMNRPAYRKTMGAFVLGTFVAVAISFITSWLDFRETSNPMEFYMKFFSPIQHPSYLAMYMNMAIFILIYNTFKRSLSRATEFFYWLLAAFLAMSLIFPASKMGLLMFLVLIISMVFVSYKLGKLFSRQSLYMALIAGFFVIFYSQDPIAQARVGTAIAVTSEEAQVKQKETRSEVESNTARFLVWSVALDGIQEHPMGVGTGATLDYLVPEYAERGYEGLAEIRLNPHNTYLELALEVGVIATIWFVFSLLFPVRMILIDQNWIYGFFILNVSLNFMVESMLEGQSGVVFFAFFNAVFFFHSKLVRDENKERVLNKNRFEI